jgi:thioredoxin-like negative regulator of GroEL
MTATRRVPLAVFRGLCALLLAQGAWPAWAEEVEWRRDYASARREAAEKDRPLLLDFGYDGCVWCQRLDAQTLRDASVARSLNGQFVPLRIDVHKDPDLAERLRIQAYPTVVLASPEGKILDVIEGFKEPSPFQERLERTLALVSNPEWMERDYREAGKAIAASDYSRAVALLKNVAQDGKGRPAQVKARQLLQDLEQQAAGRLARAKQLADKGQTTEAVDTIAELIRAFAGTPAAAEGSQMLTALAARPEIKDGPRTRRAQELLAQAREDYRTGQYVWCLNRCDVLASGYADLPEGAEAKQLAGEIKNNPEWLRQACDTLGDQLGGLYLSLAESWLRKGQPQQAALCLERVIQTLPGTRQAEAAQVRLAQIQGQPATRTVEFKKPD